MRRILRRPDCVVGQLEALTRLTDVRVFEWGIEPPGSRYWCCFGVVFELVLPGQRFLSAREKMGGVFEKESKTRLVYLRAMLGCLVEGWCHLTKKPEMR